MRTIFTLLIILGVAVPAFGQTKKMFVNSKGKISPDSIKAVAYLIEEKIGDSAYVISKYDLKHQPVFKGTYKDSLLTVRNGKFYSYLKYQIDDIEGQKKSKIHTYLASSGYYINGIRTGPWLVYDFSGAKMQQFTFEKGILNGPYKRFDTFNGTVVEIGNFVKGQREGESNIFSGKNEHPDCTIIYKHGEPIKTTFHNANPVAPDSLEPYLSKILKNHIDKLKKMEIVVTLKISENGKVDSVVSFNKPVPDSVAKAVRWAFSTAPSFVPAKRDDRSVSQEYLHDFKYGIRPHTLGELVILDNMKHTDPVTTGLDILQIEILDK